MLRKTSIIILCVYINCVYYIYIPREHACGLIFHVVRPNPQAVALGQIYILFYFLPRAEFFDVNGTKC